MKHFKRSVFFIKSFTIIKKRIKINMINKRKVVNIEEEKIKRLKELVDSITVTPKNEKLIVELKGLLETQNYEAIMEKIGELKRVNELEYDKQDEEIEEDNDEPTEEDEKNNTEQSEIELDKFPKVISNPDLEKKYIGMLLEDPKLIVRYYFLYEECFFEDNALLNLYKRVLFTDGAEYASEEAKRKFNFSRDDEEAYNLKLQLVAQVKGQNYNMEKVYTELKKLFVIRKYYIEIPVKTIQDKILEIASYKLYDQMTVSEVKAAVDQVTLTSKFKQAILNQGLSEFLKLGDNNLTNGLSLPFPILTSVFKGIRKGETMAFSMPSNSGKSRFTINIAAYTAFVHKKKVLIISNEMSEEKMRLCLITTIINNPEIQKLHGQKLSKTEGELLEFKFRPDENAKVELDEDGFVKKQENESQADFVTRLTKVSSEFNSVIKVTDWINKEINNSIYFANITDHTNEELQKIIMNFYYKEQIEYVFYDTLKTDTEHIGSGEEIKKTATILSNLAQNFGMFIGSTLQLTETATLPINLTINDLAVSRTVKEVLDTLCLIKQIHNENLDDYEYSYNEVDTEFYDLEKFEDPDVRYYACVVDKNRAGAKPKVLFRLNLAYNTWEELGYLRLKQKENNKN